MKIKDVIKSIFGEISDDDCDAILYGCTGFPCFFPKGDVSKIFYKQLHHAKRSLNRGFTIDQIYIGEDRLVK